jgi:hypothetical protein
LFINKVIHFLPYRLYMTIKMLQTQNLRLKAINDYMINYVHKTNKLQQ